MTAQPSRMRQLAYFCIFSGAIGLLGTWAFSQLEKRDGIVDGSDLYVVHARQDSAALRLTPRDEVQAGEVIAEFVSPANQGQRTLHDLHVAQAQMRTEAARVKPLVIDPVLVQREAQIRLQIAQKEGFIFDLQRSQRDVERSSLCPFDRMDTRKDPDRVRCCTLAPSQSARRGA